MSPPINNWRYRPTEHSHYAEIVTDITTPNSEQKDNTKIKNYKYEQHEPHQKTRGELRDSRRHNKYIFVLLLCSDLFAVNVNLFRLFLLVCICVSVGDTIIKRGRMGWIPLTDRSNPAIFVCLSQGRTWISNAIWHGLYLFYLR